MKKGPLKTNGWLVFVVLVGSVSSAQEPRPSVAPYPLDLKRTTRNFSEKQRKELARELRRVLSVSAQVPDTATLDSALKSPELEGQSCEQQDDCLARRPVKLARREAREDAFCIGRTERLRLKHPSDEVPAVRNPFYRSPPRRGRRVQEIESEMTVKRQFR